MEDASAAFGKGITANKTESLALSGTEYAKDFRINDARLVQDEKTIDPATMLRDTKKLQVVSHAPSDNLCRHQGRDPADCARDRSVGLRSLPAGAVSSGTALTLAVRGGRVIEQVDDVQSLDVRALLAQLVGSVQALSAQLAPLQGRSDHGARQAKPQNQELGHRVAALEMAAARQ